ncbi:MAG: dTDP-4-dehydrorhamnose 3,5-epimerase [Terriglobales bacterium]
MIFRETKIRGVWIIELDKIEDERGFFARSFCQSEFQTHGLDPCVAQCNVSYNAKAGTLRGMHFQISPHAEAKLIRCTRGALYDVALDLRSGSPTERQWVAAELTEENRAMIYIPESCAHGSQALRDGTEVLYQMSRPFHPQSARGVRWNDPAFNVSWPLPSITISDRDQSWPLVGPVCR